MVIGSVPFLNAVPLTWALPRLGFDGRLVYGTPAQLAEWLQQGAIDVGLIPVAQYLRGVGEVLIDRLGIAADGVVRSVAVFSHQPLTAPRTIAVDAGSRSSVLLLQVLLRWRWGLTPQLVPMEPDLERMLAVTDSALLIGDAALRASLNTQLHAWDLAAAWKEWTGLPFVFAAWVARDEEVARKIAPLLFAAHAEGVRRLPTIVAEEAERRHLPAEVVQHYLTEHIRHTLSEVHHEAVQRFARAAAEIGALSTVRTIRWFTL